MKKLIGILIAALLIVELVGCAPQSANVNPVGFDAAKAAALQAAGVEAADAIFDEVALKEYKGHQYYEIDFDANGREYEYYVEALSGVIISPEMAAEALGAAVNIPQGEKQPSAPDAAENPQPSANDKPEPVKEEVKADPPKADAAKSDQPKAEKQPVGESKAKSIALSHAGKKEADVKFVKAELDRDDGRVVYEVEFYDNNYMEYDYDIDAYSGEVISFDFDAEDYKKPADKPAESKPSDKPSEKPSSSEKPSEKVISEDKAKEIALSQVPGAKASDIREFKVDRDDGRIEYEGEIVYDGMEYEFEIDAYSGAIRNWDVERYERDD